jgi:hypothetical protein
MRQFTPFVALLAGCSASRLESAPRREAAPVAASPVPGFVLEAPAGVDRWEPSGAATLGDELWVANDRDGWIAAYGLPLRPGVNHPRKAWQLRTGLARTKWEEVAPAPKGGLLLWEAIGRNLWACADPGAGCPDLVPVDSEPFRAALDAALPHAVEYVTVEGFACQGERLLFGTRGLVQKGRGDDAFECWPRVFSTSGEAALDGAPWIVDGKPYGISAMALDGDTLWMTWSFEAPLDDTRNGVSGILARAAIGPDGLPRQPAFCRLFEGKPEGLAVAGDQLVVVFDNDLRRKNPKSPGHFPVAGNQDFAEVIEKAAACPEPPPM